MKTRTVLHLFIFLLCFTACDNKSVFSIVELFSKTEKLTGQTFKIAGFSENILNPADMEIINKKLVLLDVQASVPFSIIDLEKQKYVKSFGMKGEGPGEIVGVMDFYVNYDGTGINFWDAMLKRLYFCNNDSMLLYNNKCGINIIEKVKDKNLFNNFFLNVLQIDKSLYLGIGNSGNKRFSLINTKTNKVIYTGEYPKQEMSTKIDPFVNAIAYNGTIRYNKEKNRIVFISRESEMIELFDVKESGLELIYGNYSTVPIGEQKTEGKDRGRNIGIAVSDNYIFILCQPRAKVSNTQKDKRRVNSANDVLVFNWDGKPVIHYKLDNKIASISVTKDSKRLYALINKEEPQIIYYDLNF
ncbi:MAG: BF3164 family lipoprotein [Bacteroidales bacterium]|nr:BF3164 family lipoprotein [Bacteroidales bacterium]